MIQLPTGTKEFREASLIHFAEELERIGRGVGFKMSSRGWCYLLEGIGLITKAEFDRAENAINECREKGYLPIDFTAEEEGRKFSGVEDPTLMDAGDFIGIYLDAVANCEKYYTPDWWEGEHYYIQMLVEKIDLKTLFEPVCKDYHIPIATSKGWSSMLQRAEYAKRFKDAEERGLQCILLYCGDHDPDGLRISKNIFDNLDALKNIVWEDGTEGYDPKDLIIERFGLNYNFIIENGLTWIDNLITGSKKNLADQHHKNHFMPYVQTYIRTVGIRKCEANAIVKQPGMGRTLCRNAIEKFLNDGTVEDNYSEDAIARFKVRRDRVNRYIRKARKTITITKTNLEEAIQEAIKNVPHDDMEAENNG